MNTTPSCPPVTPGNPFDIAKFRAAMPVFKDTEKYPDDMIIFWADFAWSCIGPNACFWGNQLCYALYLLTAHYVALEGQAMAFAGVGGMPGVQRGPITSETPGQVSLSYDTGSVLVDGAGPLNATTYGTNFYRMARLRGTFPIQVNTGPGLMCGGGCGVTADGRPILTPLAPKSVLQGELGISAMAVAGALGVGQTPVAEAWPGPGAPRYPGDTF